MGPIIDKLQYWAHSPEAQAEATELGYQIGQYLVYHPLIAVGLVSMTLLIVYVVEHKNESTK